MKKMFTNVQEMKEVIMTREKLLWHEVTLINILWAQVSCLFLTCQVGIVVAIYITIIIYHYSWLEC